MAETKLSETETKRRFGALEDIYNDVSNTFEMYEFEGYNRTVLLSIVMRTKTLARRYFKLAVILFNNGTNPNRIKEIMMPGENMTVYEFLSMEQDNYTHNKPTKKTHITANRLMSIFAPQLFSLVCKRVEGKMMPSHLDRVDSRICHLCFASLPFKDEVRRDFENFKQRASSWLKGDQTKSISVYNIQLSQINNWSDWDWHYLSHGQDLLIQKPAGLINYPRLIRISSENFDAIRDQDMDEKKEETKIDDDIMPISELAKWFLGRNMTLVSIEGCYKDDKGQCFVHQNGSNNAIPTEVYDSMCKHYPDKIVVINI